MEEERVCGCADGAIAWALFDPQGMCEVSFWAVMGYLMAATYESGYCGSIVLANSAGFLVTLMQHNEAVGGIEGLVLYYWHKQCIHTYCMHKSNTVQPRLVSA